jgi:hypothetical protein
MSKCEKCGEYVEDIQTITQFGYDILCEKCYLEQLEFRYLVRCPTTRVIEILVTSKQMLSGDEIVDKAKKIAKENKIDASIYWDRVDWVGLAKRYWDKYF